MKKNSAVRSAMSVLGSMGGKANVKRHGKAHMRKIAKAYWDKKKAA